METTPIIHWLNYKALIKLFLFRNSMHDMIHNNEYVDFNSLYGIE